jgi:ankyrin repeat protein
MKTYILIPLLALLCGCMSIPEKNWVLLQAAQSGDTATVKRMLDKKADINTKDNSGETPLLAAIKNRRPETIRFLVSRGANLNVKDIAGETALLIAIKMGDTNSTELIASSGADLDAKERYGDTALALAIKNGQRDLAKLLVSKGANINVKGALGDTPLHVSVYKGDAEVTSVLRSKGAEETLLNRYGLNPAEMQSLPEIEAKVVETAQLLSSSGQWTNPSKARSLYDGLKARQDKYLINALVLRVIRADDMRLRVLLLAIKLGIPGSEEKLGALLMEYGDKSMAEDYLNSGSSLLHSSGVAWANSHGYHIQTGQGSNRSNWGSF